MSKWLFQTQVTNNDSAVEEYVASFAILPGEQPVFNISLSTEVPSGGAATAIATLTVTDPNGFTSSSSTSALDLTTNLFTQAQVPAPITASPGTGAALTTLLMVSYSITFTGAVGDGGVNVLIVKQ